MRFGKTTIFKTIGAVGLPAAFAVIAVTTFAMAWSANTSAAPIVAPSVLRSSATTTTEAPTTTLAPTTTSSTTTSTTSTTTTTPPPPPPPPPAPVKKKAAPKPAPVAAPAPAGAVTEVGGVAAQCIALTNAERAAHGVAPVTYNAQLQAAAQGWSNYQASIQTMSHNAGGSTPGARISAAGYGWHAYGENVAAGQGSCGSVLAAWIASPGHEANIVNPAFVHIGVALAKDANGRPYWTMDLAAP